VKIGFLGAGLIGTEHVTGISGLISADLIEAELFGVYDPNIGRAGEFKKKFGFKRVFSSAAELIKSDDIQVVFITAWTGAHRELVDIVAQEAKPVFCEKPLGRNLAEARSISSTIEAAGIPNQIGLILRTSPSFGFARHLLQDTSLGRLMAVVFRDDQYFPIQGHYKSDWRKDHATTGGGTFIEHSIHDVDLMRWMFGDFTQVRAISRQFAGYDKVEDLTIATAEFARGGHVTFTSIWHNILTRESSRHLEIFFENGRIVVEDEVFGPVSIELGDKPVKIFDQSDIGRWYMDASPEIMTIGPAVTAPTTLEDYRFLKALLDGRKPEPDFKVGVAAHEVVEAVYRSAKEDRPVSLPLE